MEKKTIPKTEYHLAWEKYTSSSEYKKCVNELWRHRINESYATNILRSAFDAGWNMPKIK